MKTGNYHNLKYIIKFFWYWIWSFFHRKPEECDYGPWDFRTMKKQVSSPTSSDDENEYFEDGTIGPAAGKQRHGVNSTSLVRSYFYSSIAIFRYKNDSSHLILMSVI